MRTQSSPPLPAPSCVTQAISTGAVTSTAFFSQSLLVSVFFAETAAETVAVDASLVRSLAEAESLARPPAIASLATPPAPVA